MTERVTVTGVSKTYRLGKVDVTALAGVSLTVRAGEFLAVAGPSGSGKTTLLNLIGCLDTPTSGSYRLKGMEVAGMTDDELAGIRNGEIGFIFQTFNLLPRSDAVQNVELPLVYAGVPRRERRERAQEALRSVGLGDRMHHRPNEMSGGQRQRVAVARALVNRPSILMADEPTGNLDSKTGDEIMALMDQLHSQGRTIILVTHEEELALRAARVLRLRDGRVLSDQRNAQVALGRA